MFGTPGKMVTGGFLQHSESTLTATHPLGPPGWSTPLSSTHPKHRGPW